MTDDFLRRNFGGPQVGILDVTIGGAVDCSGKLLSIVMKLLNTREEVHVRRKEAVPFATHLSGEEQTRIAEVFASNYIAPLAHIWQCSRNNLPKWSA